MKFLMISSMKDTFTMLPPAVARQLLEGTLSWSDEQKKRGKLLEAYESVEISAAIFELASAEEMVQMIATVPMGGFLNLKVYPLADYNKSMEAYIEAYKQAETLFPSAPK